jgi:hypothetical protein
MASELDYWQRLTAYVKEIGKKQTEIASQAGRYDDGGGGALQDQVDCYLAGLARKIPYQWEKFAAEFNNVERAKLDPDYEAAQRFLRRNPEYLNPKKEI